MRFNVIVSGRTWAEVLDPKSNGFPDSIGLPTPLMRRAGPGKQAVYENITKHQALKLAAYLEWIGLRYQQDEKTKPVGHKMVRTAVRIRSQIKSGEGTGNDKAQLVQR